MTGLLDLVPGSPVAIARGCRCPEQHDKTVWVLDVACPIHWPRPLPFEEPRS